jgi:sulfate/thiosulfate transport system permease protein
VAAASPTIATPHSAATFEVSAQRRVRPVRKTFVSPRGALVSTYLTVIVLIPIAALIAQAAQGGAWRAITSPQTLAAVELTVLTSIIVMLVDVVVGIATAWVLVRDDFPGRQLLDAAIDLPLALPTIVAGLTLLTLYGADSPVGLNLAYTRMAIGLALLFVSFPFVVRAVQPLLHALDPEVEAAARSMGAGGWTLFRYIHLPQLMPAVLSGAALAFARALGEYGAVVLLSGNIPFQTQVASVYIFGDVEQGNTADAAAISLVLLLLTLAVLVGADVLRRRYTADAN